MTQNGNPIGASSSVVDETRAGSTPVADGKGERKNERKNRLELLPPEWLCALGEVTTRGSFKYAERNWERGMRKSIMVGCALRHLLKRVCGEIYDPETGCAHTAMAAWNMLALMSYDIRGIGEDDLVGKLEWLDATVNSPMASVASRFGE